MRIVEAGYIDDRVLFLGTNRVASYLVMGESYALIGGGVAWGVARLEEQLDRFLIDRKRIRYLVISHAHHDHCGAVPYLCRRYPQLETVASRYGAHILAKKEAVDLMRGLNRRTIDHQEKPHSHAGVSLDFDAVAVQHQVGDGDELALGEGVTLQFFDTPGHSRCSLSVYVPERRALFPGDAIPYPEPGRAGLTVTANHDYADYLRSLEKLGALDVDLVAYEHGGVLAGDEAEGIVARGARAAQEQRERIRKRYAEIGSLDLLVAETVKKYRSVELFRMVSAEVMSAIVGRMIRSALEPD